MRKLFAAIVATLVPVVVSMLFIGLLLLSPSAAEDDALLRGGAMLFGALIPASVVILLFYGFLSVLNDLRLQRCLAYTAGFALALALLFMLGFLGALGFAAALLAALGVFVYAGATLALATMVFWIIVRKPQGERPQSNEPATDG